MVVIYRGWHKIRESKNELVFKKDRVGFLVNVVRRDNPEGDGFVWGVHTVDKTKKGFEVDYLGGYSNKDSALLVAQKFMKNN